MSLAIDLATFKAQKSEVLPSNIRNLIEETVDLNKGMVILSIKNLKHYAPSFIIDTITLQLVNEMYKDKSHEDLQEAIKSVLFKIKEGIQHGLFDDEDIWEAIKRSDYQQ
ncbi:hypothetical protein LCM23_14540 [Cytobacillus kochii]|uniref:hypothetical protein n=1 Tax=Cytobacillus kochii TaxID=859143 RepID=UPI001CD66EB7|nr:hypothetical protein [Cytobacillus kochii]MCA1027316.1 hypothetical protein [Cytobacillus kochii]